ncbi:hypothetical protein A8H39_01910 [Paraburkholderia fungorum]|uniref:hypothetical protein n=1 Tax=Paraburkholderia fungorum TaxID=134537 RepID=UPI000482B6FB|nr:hypothetical protein [Paraburkholderia fungorum]MBB5546596.1 hypothetical protein [Paraburkholderia fungorum]PNE59927.1 hypothetical protein A8H39_01910 [Paraburkholderia fungorum]
MPFLAISCFLMYANLLAAVRYVQRGTGTFASGMLGAGHMVACLVSSLGFLFGMELLVFDRDGGIAGDAYNWTPVFYLAFGVLSLILFGVKLYGKLREPAQNQGVGLILGMTLWAVLASIYIFLTTVDHLIFFHDRERSGQMDVSYSGEQMTCSGGMILVRIKGNTAIYRCPQSLRLGRDYAAPFAPWPSYVENSSMKLRAQIDAVLNGGSQKPGIVAVPASEIKVMPNAGSN